jgi:23S rRNA (adenine2503-C2)-methyltransferase
VNTELLEETLAGEPAYRARQVWEWTARGASSYAEMTNVPAGLRVRLEEQVPFSSLSVEHEAVSKDGTVKTLFRTHDGHPVEAVLMRYRDGRRSICVSSQSGCPLTCTFCATGQMRFGRNLEPWEIVDQALHFRRLDAVDHCVFMGMGEPMLNLDNVVSAARRLPDLGITHRRTTISTVGWMPGLTRFVDEVDERRFALLCPCTRPTRICARGSCPSRSGIRSTRCSPSAGATTHCATGRCSSST